MALVSARQPHQLQPHQAQRQQARGHHGTLGAGQGQPHQIAQPGNAHHRSQHHHHRGGNAPKPGVRVGHAQQRGARQIPVGQNQQQHAQHQRAKHHGASLVGVPALVHQPGLAAQQHCRQAQALQHRPQQRCGRKGRVGDRARCACHGVAVFGLGFEDDGAGRVDQQLQQHDVHRKQQHRPVQQCGHQRQPDDGHMHGKHKAHGLADVAVDAPPLADGSHDAGKAVVQQHQRGGLARHVGAALAHGNAHVGGLEGGRIVHAVAGHGHHLPAGAQQLHQAQLVLGLEARAQVHMAQPLAEGSIVKPLQLRAGDDVGAVGQAHLLGDGAGRGGVVAGHHDHADTGTSALGQCGGHLGARRVGQGHQAEKIKVEIVLALRPRRALAGCRGCAFPAAARHAQHAQAALGHGLHLAADGALLRGVKVAQVGHGLGCALGGQQVHVGLVAGKHARHGQNLARQGVFKLGLASIVHMLGALQPLVAKMLDGLFHGVERVGGRGQHGKFGQQVKVLGQFTGAFGPEMLLAAGQLGHGHAVHGERACFVHCQHRDGAQRLNSGDAPCQHLLVRNAPRTQRQKHGQNDRNLLGQDGHGQRNARQQAFEQRAAVPPPAQKYLGQGQHQRANSEIAHQSARALLQRRRRLYRGGKVGANAPHGRVGGGGAHLRHRHAARDHGAGVDGPHACHFVCCAAPRGGWPGLGRPGVGGRGPRACHFVCCAVPRGGWPGLGRPCAGGRGPRAGRCLRVLAVLCQGQFGHGHGFAGEQGFVHFELAVDQQRVGGNAVALVQHEQIAAHHLAPGNALFLAVADHQRARGRQVAQGFERALGLAFLRQRDADDHKHKAQQEQRLAPVAQRQVDAASGQQHEKHGLGNHVPHDGQRGLGRAARQQVGAFGGEAAGRLGSAQPLTRWYRRGRLAFGGGHGRRVFWRCLMACAPPAPAMPTGHSAGFPRSAPLHSRAVR